MITIDRRAGADARALVHIDTATNEPIMNTSPWAKLISSMIP